MDGIRKRQYGLSDGTWMRGPRELREAGLLAVTDDLFCSQVEPRRRDIYTLRGRLAVSDPGDLVLGTQISSYRAWTS